MARVGGVSGLVCALLLGSVLSACGEAGADDEPAGGTTKGAAPATITDPTGDTWNETVRNKRSQRTVNVDLAGLTATYDDGGLVLTVTYAEPLEGTARDFGLLVNLDHDPGRASDVIALDWSNERPTRVTVLDRADYLYFCKGRADADYAAGTVTLILPATTGCLGKTQPERLRVLYLASTAGDATDTVFSDGQAAPKADFWVARG